jgi:hypothetical protein
MIARVPRPTALDEVGTVQHPALTGWAKLFRAYGAWLLVAQGVCNADKRTLCANAAPAGN